MKHLFTACWAISLVVFIGCSSQPGEGRSSEPESTFIYVNTISEQNIGSIDIGENIVITAGADRLSGRVNMDKTEYLSEGGQVAYSVKQDADGFKIKSGDKTVIKVKWAYDDKIKLADNDEMESPWEVKLNENQKFKISHNEELQIEYKLSFSGNKVWEGEEYKFSGLDGSLAPGVMQIDIGTTLEKMIVIATLSKAGK